MRAVLVAFFSIAGIRLGAATKPLTVAVSTEAAPPGGTVQIKFFAGHPQQIASGELSIDLDPAFFSSIRSVAVFSTAGDAYGFAAVTGLHADMHFGSLTGGIGQSSSFPILTVTASVGAPPNSTVVIADPTGSEWKDPAGDVYAVTVIPGTVTAGGSLSISDVEPGGGILPAGTPIQISGTGFIGSTTVQIDAASVASVQVLGPQQIQLTLGAPTDLTGKRIHVMNPDGSGVDYFPSQPSSPVTEPPTAALVGLLPILPLETYRAAVWSQSSQYGTEVVALQNPTTAPVDVLIGGLLGTDLTGVTATIPPNDWYFLAHTDTQPVAGFRVLASAPIRMLKLANLVESLFVPPTATIIAAFPAAATNVPPLQVSPTLMGVPPASPGTVGGGATVMWTCQAGTAPPPQYIGVYSDYNDAEEPAAYTISVATESGGSWLSVSQTSGASCSVSSSCPPIAVTANPASLATGSYRATITFTPVGTSVRPNVLPSTIGVGLTVTAGKPVIVSFNQAVFLNWNGRIYFSPTSYPIPTSIIPDAFNVTVTTEGGGNWLVATPSSGTTPASVSVSALPVTASPGSYVGRVIVSGSGNSYVIDGLLRVYGSTMLSCDDVRLSAQAGAPSPPARSASVTTFCDSGAGPCPNPPLSPGTLTASVSTSSGGAWLSATVAGESISVSANSTGLPAGLYFGVINLSSNTAAPVQVPVSLLVWSGPVPLLVASPPTLSWSDSSGTQLCASSSENIPLDLTTQISTTDGGSWLTTSYGSTTTPSCPNVGADATGLLPGTYHGSIVFTGGGQSVTVPVSLTVSAPATDQPLLGTIVNAASGVSGSIAPGEVITIHGLGLGPTSPTGLTIDSKGQVATELGETSLLIGGIAAPLLFAAQSQINAIVPYEIAGQQIVIVQAQSGGVSSPVWGIPVADAAPGIFTTDSSGQGPGAILNQDNSVNAPSNPAAVGSVIQIYATGEGQTNPPGKTGTIASGENSPVLPVSVSIGGIGAQVSYSGTAPTAVEGLFQINTIVPPGIVSGAAVPIRVTVGSAQSQPGVTIAVK